MSVSAVVRRWTLAIPLAASVALSAPLRDAAAQPPAALVGRVTSAAEGPMEGVLVSAKRDGSTKTVTVVSRADGAYAFPRDRLEPGRYALSVRAVKYVLADARRRERRDRGRRHRRKLDLDAARHRTRSSSRCSSPIPSGSRATRSTTRRSGSCFATAAAATRCAGRRCRRTTPRSSRGCMKRMVYSAGSSPMRFQLPGAATPHWGRAEGGEPSGLQRRQAEAVAAINLHNGMWNYELKTLPRPKGKETEVIYTTWDLPATSRPHDTRIAADGSDLVQPLQRQRHRPARSEDRRDEGMAVAVSREGGLVPADRRAHADGPGRAAAAGTSAIRRKAASSSSIPKTEQFEFHDPPGGGEMIDVSGAHVGRQRVARGGRAGRGRRRLSNRSRDVGAHRDQGHEREAAVRLRHRGGLAQQRVRQRARQRRTCGASTRRRTKFSTTTFRPSRAARARSAPACGAASRTPQDRLWWGGYDGGFIGLLDPRKPAGEQMKLYAGAATVLLPVRRALRRARLHVDRRHLCRPRRASERRDRRMEFLSVAVRSEHPRHQLAAGRGDGICRGFGSDTRIRR